MNGKGGDRSKLAFRDVARDLAALGRKFGERGWMLGTSGNLSAVVRRDPLELAITPSGVDKGSLSAERILRVDPQGRILGGEGRPSAETALHVGVLRRGAGGVIHTHSVWGTLVSEAGAPDGGVELAGYEMLKALRGITTHEHREWLPVVENNQEMSLLARSMEEAQQRHPACHGVLIRGHGLYTWGEDLPEAARHVEALEFLLEVAGRSRAAR